MERRRLIISREIERVGPSSLVWDMQQPSPAADNRFIVRVPDTQTPFRVSGAGTVAGIDTGVDPAHPVLQSVLVPGYDFTRNIAGSASELAEVNQSSSGSGTSPAMVNQSTAAVLDPASALNLGQPEYQ